MNKHIFPIISIICLTIAIFVLLYEYFQKGIVTRNGWLTLLLMVSVFMINIPYWKNYFQKYDNSLSIIRYFNTGFLNFDSSFNLNG